MTAAPGIRLVANRVVTDRECGSLDLLDRERQSSQDQQPAAASRNPLFFQLTHQGLAQSVEDRA